MTEIIDVLFPTDRIDQDTQIALESILNQEQINVRIIIILNGQAASKKLPAKFQSFENITVLRTKQSGIVNALNIGIEYPHRLRKQLRYLIDNDLDVVGTNIKIKNTKKSSSSIRLYPKENSECRQLLHYGSCFAHPSILTKTSLLKRYRYQHSPSSEDYDLWLRLAENTEIKFGNIQEPLLLYTVHPRQLSSTNSTEMEQSIQRVLNVDSTSYYQKMVLSPLVLTQALQVLSFNTLVHYSSLYYLLRYPTVYLSALCRRVLL